MQPERFTIDVRCARCKKRAAAAYVEGYGAKWLAPPQGWWVLLECGEVHVRCPSCLVSPAEKG